MGWKQRAGRTTVGLTAGAMVMLAGAVTADEGPGLVPPTAFSGHLGCGLAFGSPTIARHAGLGADGTDTAEHVRDASWRFPVIEISDARLDGTFVNTFNAFVFSDDAGDEMGVYSATWSISGTDGSWSGPTTNVSLPATDYGTTSTLLAGSGGYEGLSAFMEADWRDDCGWDITGVILEGDPPTYPEPALP